MFGSARPAVELGADQGVELGAGGVVFDRSGKVLLLRRRCGDWVFPKGHIDEGETAVQAALREIAEEAGVSADCRETGRTWTTAYVNKGGRRREITWFACETEAAKLDLGEALFPEGGFFEPHEALERLSHQADRDLLRAVSTWRAELAREVG